VRDCLLFDFRVVLETACGDLVEDVKAFDAGDGLLFGENNVSIGGFVVKGELEGIGQDRDRSVCLGGTKDDVGVLDGMEKEAVEEVLNLGPETVLCNLSLQLPLVLSNSPSIDLSERDITVKHNEDRTEAPSLSNAVEMGVHVGERPRWYSLTRRASTEKSNW
jgi:hypothetical protein